MGDPAVNITGLSEFRRALRDLDGNWTKELTKVHKAIAEDAAGHARSIADGMGGIQAKASGAIKGRGTSGRASVAVRKGASYPEAFSAFWGAKGRSGWNAANGDSAPQHPPWVGNNWDVGVAGQGPYAINEALARELPRLEERYKDMLDDLTRRAFPL